MIEASWASEASGASGGERLRYGPWGYATRTLLRGSLVALTIALLGGLLSALYSVPALAELLEPLGSDMRTLRPLHTTFAAAFVFLGGVAVVHRYFMDQGVPIVAGDRLRVRVQMICWAIAGLAVLVTLPLGITSGREYVDFHPAISTFIALGWLCFTWNFFRTTWRGFWERPVYVTMWAVGCLFFLYTFAEQHAYLLPEVFGDPLVDRRVQWKACGTLVGSMNLFVYGSLIYVGEKVSGEAGYGRSRKAYALFAVGLLNSFTNFAHHTYHLPQNHLSKWIAFVISMAEIIILFSTVIDLARMVRRRSGREGCTDALFMATKWWTGMMLGTSILISIPPLNALIHGTYVVTGHAMGTMIGIDTMAILGCFAFLIGEVRELQGVGPGGSGRCPGSLRTVVAAINFSVAGMVVWLHLVGLVDGVQRYLAPTGTPAAEYRPPWLLGSSALVLALTGTAAFLAFFTLLGYWLPQAFSPLRRGGGERGLCKVPAAK